MTVLFSDASGYTQMAESVDAEVVRELMNLVYDKAGEIVSRYGGRIDKLMGDAVLAVFGDPVVHEDDAVRRGARRARAPQRGQRAPSRRSRLVPGTPSRCTAASTAGS